MTRTSKRYLTKRSVRKSFFLAMILFGPASFANEPSQPQTPVPSMAPKAAQSTRIAARDSRVRARASTAENEINLPENVIDESFETRWSAKGDEQWIELEFDEAREIDFVDLAFYKGSTRRAYFDIKTSLDGREWENQISDGVSSGKQDDFQRFEFMPVKTRFVRYVGYGNNSKEASTRPWNSLTRFSAGSSKSRVSSSDAKRLKIKLGHWKITFPDASEEGTSWLTSGGIKKGLFDYTQNGAIVFTTPNMASSTKNSKYSRTELREMLLGENAKGKVQGHTRNNWVLSVADQKYRERVGGVDGRLAATLAVNRVSISGDEKKVGRVIVGQIHASKDEPVKIFYRRFPGHSLGSVYMNTEDRAGRVRWFRLIGNRAWKKNQVEPKEGIRLDEVWSYTIDIDGYYITVTIDRDDQQEITKRFKMSKKYKDDWMYFKAGTYNQNNTGDQDDYVQATFYKLNASHD